MQKKSVATNTGLQYLLKNVIGVSVTPGRKVGFSGVCRPYQLKLFKQLKSRAECALWFMKSYGLEIDSIQMREGNGLRYNVNYRN